jgi:hypothetical protein
MCLAVMAKGMPVGGIRAAASLSPDGASPLSLA